MGIGRVASTKVANLDNILFLHYNTGIARLGQLAAIVCRVTDGILAYVSILQGVSILMCLA